MFRVATTELLGHRMLSFVKADQILAVTEDHRLGGDHFGVQQGVLADQPGQITEVTGGPVHHRSDGQTAANGGAGWCTHGGGSLAGFVWALTPTFTYVPGRNRRHILRGRVRWWLVTSRQLEVHTLPYAELAVVMDSSYAEIPCATAQ